MKIKELINNHVVLTEAARFGNDQRQAVLSIINSFRFGVEYEFNVDEGVSFLDKYIDIDSPMDSPLIRSIASNLEKIAKGVNTLNKFGGVATVDDHIGSLTEFAIGSPSEEERRYIAGTVIPETSELCTWFYSHIAVPSEAVRKAYKGDVLKGMGVLYGSITPAELEVVRRVSRLANMRVELTADIAKSFKVALVALARYLKKDAGYINQNTGQQSHFEVMLSLLRDDIVEEMKSKESKVQVVARELPINRAFIEDITPDVTVPDGVEVVTKPLDFNTTMGVMRDIFQYIQKVGHTDDKTGLHVNISISPDIGDISHLNYAKMMVLLDTDFYQSLSRGSSKFIKYPVRSDWVTPMSQFLTKKIGFSNDTYIESLARTYATAGADAFISLFEKYIIEDNEKMRAINLQHIFKNAEVSARRIEFRFLGGKDYEHRLNEIGDDILQFCYAIAASASGSFLRREYLIGIIRMLDRAARGYEIGGERMTGFASLVNFYRR